MQVETEKQKMVGEMEALKLQLAAAQAQAEKRNAPSSAPVNDKEFINDKDKLLSDFEARRKELEQHQKQEQDRQERLLQELLEMKKKKRKDKVAKAEAE